MRTKKKSAAWICALLQLALILPMGPVALSASGPAVALRASSGAVIEFWTQNGSTLDGISPQLLYLPHLVLYRNGVLAPPEERTLIVEVSGIELPPGGVTVTLELTTQHEDPDRADGAGGIAVWRESRWISNESRLTRTGGRVIFQVEFDETVLSGGEEISTPTDYYRCELEVLAGDSAQRLFGHSEDAAFLLENQWRAALPGVPEDAPGAAPDELVVYYCDMFPFRRDVYDPGTWLPRATVTAYVGGELVPAMAEAFRAQSGDWGFTWHRGRAGRRSGTDAVCLGIALSEGKAWFHGQAPAYGHTGISINVDAAHGTLADYDTLTDGLLSVFHHELFHHFQRDIELYYGGKGDLNGRGGAWAFFSEGTAVLASSVGQPAVQFDRVDGMRNYMTYANIFLGGVGSQSQLNTGYDDLIPYYAAVYWRFLYEQCGGMRDGVENPAAGMDIIRRVLAVLYSGEVVNIRAATDLVRYLPAVMDRALEGSACPFQAYEESLAAFGCALYALGLDGGRRVVPGPLADRGLSDPHQLYPDPPVDRVPYAGGTVIYTGADQAYPPGIPSSFGIDLVEVLLSPAVHGQALAVEFYGAPGAAAEFNVQVWVWTEAEGGGAAAAQVLSQETTPGRSLYVIPAVDTIEYDRLGLVVVRTDADEAPGAYTVALHPAAPEGLLPNLFGNY